MRELFSVCERASGTTADIVNPRNAARGSGCAQKGWKDMFSLQYSGTLIDLVWSLWLAWGVMVPIMALWRSTNWRISGGKLAPVQLSR